MYPVHLGFECNIPILSHSRLTFLSFQARDLARTPERTACCAAGVCLCYLCYIGKEKWGAYLTRDGQLRHAAGRTQLPFSWSLIFARFRVNLETITIFIQWSLASCTNTKLLSAPTSPTLEKALKDRARKIYRLLGWSSIVQASKFQPRNLLFSSKFRPGCRSIHETGWLNSRTAFSSSSKLLLLSIY